MEKNNNKKKDNFTFGELILFGSFILELLTFIFMFCK